MTESTRSLLGFCILVVVLTSQIVGALRYVNRLPDDRLGLALYLTTIAGAFIVAFLLLANWWEVRRHA